MLLEKMPALSAILQEISSYLDSIEGNEEAKGEEIGHFIAEQVIHLLLPSKTKVVSSLAKVTKLNKLGGKAAGIIAGELEKAGKGKKGKKGHKKGNSKDRPTIPKKSIENVLSKEKYYERARNKALELVGNLGVDSKPFFCDLPKSSAFGKIVGRQSADGKIHWRLDYDPKVGPHINVMDIRAGKKLKAKNYLIPFEGDEQLFEKLVNNLNK
jgi:hypothetical protein